MFCMLYYHVMSDQWICDPLRFPGSAMSAEPEARSGPEACVEANIIGPTNVWLICIIIKHVILPLV
jgi:hypothetical protein